RRRKGCGESARKRRRKESRETRREEEIVCVAAWLGLGVRTRPAHGEPASHRGLGKSWRGVCEDTAQCRVPRGGTVSRTLGRELGLREKIQHASRAGGAG